MKRYIYARDRKTQRQIQILTNNVERQTVKSRRGVFVIRQASKFGENV